MFKFPSDVFNYAIGIPFFKDRVLSRSCLSLSSSCVFPWISFPSILHAPAPVLHLSSPHLPAITLFIKDSIYTLCFPCSVSSKCSKCVIPGCFLVYLLLNIVFEATFVWLRDSYTLQVQEPIFFSGTRRYRYLDLFTTQ